MASGPGGETLSVVLERDTAHAHLIARLSADRLKLFLEATRLGEAQVYREEVLSFVKELTDDSLIHHPVIDDIVRVLNESGEVEPRRVARGKEPGAGRDGKIVFLVKKYSPSNKNASVVEFVDYRFLKLFDNVTKGTPVARIYPPAPGTFGIDALGDPLAAPEGKALDVKFDESLQAVPPEGVHRFTTLVATKDGYLLEEGNKLRINSELIISGNVDFKTGDIDFIGSVVVKKDVTKNFRVAAQAGVVVHGNVQSGSLHSAAGAIEVKGSVSGLEGASITIGDNFSSGMLTEVIGDKRPRISAALGFQAHMVSGVDVETSGDIVIVKEARDSILRTRGTLRMPEGHLLGGELYTVCGAEINIIGSAGGVRTIIHLCSDVESSAEYASLVRQIAEHEHAAEMTRLYIGPHLKNTKQLPSLSPQIREKIHTMLFKLSQITKSLEKLQAERDKLLQEARHNITYRINYKKKLYSGVTIRAGEVVLKVQEDLNGPGTVEYSPLEKTFRVTELRPLECVLEKPQRT